ncbi:MAG: HPr family phosphocarrier protein [Flavobacteriaceae bacterium]
MKDSHTVTVQICNRKGLHARASAAFVRTAERFDADIAVTLDGQTVGGTSIMALLTMAAGPGSEIEIRASGPQAAEAVEALRVLVETGFGEDTEGRCQPGRVAI